MDEKLKEILDVELRNIQNEIKDFDFTILPENGYVIPMTFYYALKYSDEIVNNVPRLSSADHITLFKVLNIILANLVNKVGFEEEKFEPFFDMGICVDPLIKELFGSLLSNLFNLNFITSIKEKYWKVSLDGETIKFSIRKSLRRTALHVLSTKVEYLSYDSFVKKILKNPQKYDPVLLPLRQGLNELDVISKGVPDAWEMFFKNLNYSQEDIIAFRGFIIYLQGTMRTWFKYEDLLTLWKQYLIDYKLKDTNDEAFKELLSFFSVTPNQAVDWGVQTPFIRIGNWYAYWFFYFHIMHPDLTLVTLWVRKHQRLWDNTIGAKMAGVSSYLRDTLNNVENVLIVSERKRKNIGDIDLALYDTIEDYLVICEIKTVFDKFRTNYQLTNFLNQKVNFNKANTQIRKNITEITSGNWTLSDIFNIKNKKTPKKITPIILTWWDIINYNEQTDDEDILSCNFKTFIYLYKAAKGNLGALTDTIKQLSRIYCPAYLVHDSIKYIDEQIPYVRELQTDILQPSYMINKQILNKLSAKEVASLPKFPENWKEQFEKKEEETDLFSFY